ncbi:MAG: substrate-binding domain-containing protein [Lachnospiraceae bacterium]|nr:substrate-binding domain-containing protein [Lachnospiraceae bacterium]
MKKNKHKVLLLCAFSALSLCACASSDSNDDNISAFESTEESLTESADAETTAYNESTVSESETEEKVTEPEETLSYDINAEQEQIYTKPEETLPNDFVPSENYGAVFPYAGEMVKIKVSGAVLGPDDIESYTYSIKYGFCTKDGQIITEPYFDYVYPGDDYYTVENYLSTENKYGMISYSGEKYTGCDYSFIYNGNDGSIYALKGDGYERTITVFSKDLDIVAGESPFLIATDITLDPEINNIIILPQNNRAVINGRLCDTQNGYSLDDYWIISDDYSLRRNNMLLAYGSDGKYCLIDTDGTEISAKYSERFETALPLFIARNDTHDDYDVIDPSGKKIGTIAADAYPVNMGGYLMVRSKTGNYNIYDENFKLIASDIETTGECVGVDSYTGEKHSPLICDYKNGMLFDPVSGQSIYIGGRFSVIMFNSMLYINSKGKTILCNDGLDLVDIYDDQLNYIIKDKKNNSPYFVTGNSNKTHEIRNPANYDLLAVIPSNNYYFSIYDGICFISYFIPEEEKAVTRMFNLNDPSNAIFRYTAYPAEEKENTAFDQSTFPVIDGSTSTKPMAVAVRSLLLGEGRDKADNEMEFHKTSLSFEYLINEDADLLIVAQPSDEVFDMMKEVDFEYEMEAFALEGLVFVCNKNNPVDSLTSQQIIDIYTGKITNWKEVGGNDEEIIPVQRNHSSGSQVMMDNLVMQGNEMMEVPTKLMPGGMGELIEVVESYDNSSNALGYTPYYYATAMGMADKLKILKVNDVMPSSETIKSREYPYVNPYYVVIAKDRETTDEARILYDWILSKDGQKLTEMEGYVPAVTDPAESAFEVDWNYYEKALNDDEEIYTRLSEGALPDFVSSNDYGFVFPYCGVRAKMPRVEEYEDPSHDYEWIDGDTYNIKYGFCSSNGVILTDPCFNDHYTWNDHFYNVSMGDGENKRYGVISRKGDKYTGCIYSAIYYFNNNIYAVKGSGDDKTLTIYSEDVDLLCEEAPLKIDDDFIYDDIENHIYNFPAYDRVIYKDKLYNTLTGEVLSDHYLINAEVPIDKKALIAGCDNDEYCLIDLDGNEITDHYSMIIFNCPLFIASKKGMDHFDVINGNGVIVDAIKTTESNDIQGCGSYYMVRNKDGKFDMYDSNMQTVAKNLETFGEFIFSDYASINSVQACPFVKGMKDGVVIDPLTGKSIEAGDVYSALRTEDSITLRTTKKVLHCSKDMEVLDEISQLYFYELKDQSTDKVYLIFSDYNNEKNIIRDAKTFEVVATLPYKENVNTINDGLCLTYIRDNTTDSCFSRIFPLNAPEDNVFLYRAFDSIGDIE